MRVLGLDILKEGIIYPSIICSLYGFVNERSWRVNSVFVWINFFLFLYAILNDALYTKLKYIWATLKALIKEYANSDDWDDKCCLTSFWLIPLFLVMLIHWLILAIVGVRIYVDNFSREIDQGTKPETGDYNVTPFTGYMIPCGIYLPVASAIVFVVINRENLADGIDSCCDLFHFLADPVAYITAPSLMAPFAAFCVGIFLPDYDSSQFEVDANLKDTITYLGIVFIIVFIFFNIQATLVFLITVMVIGIIASIIFIIATIIVAIVTEPLGLICVICVCCCCAYCCDKNE